MKTLYRHFFRLADGRSFEVAPTECRRTLDRRGDWENPQLVWEIKEGMIWQRYWPEEVVEWKLLSQ